MTAQESAPPALNRLSAVDRSDLLEQLAEARRTGQWAVLAGSLVRARARGVRVAALSGVLGVNSERVRPICREHGPDPATVVDPLADGAGWTPRRPVCIRVRPTGTRSPPQTARRRLRA